jgi:hypothetical protein
MHVCIYTHENRKQILTISAVGLIWQEITTCKLCQNIFKYIDMDVKKGNSVIPQ